MTRSGACSDFPINVTSTWLSASSAEASERAAEYPQPTITRFCRNRRERCGQCDDRPGVLDDQPLPPDPAAITACGMPMSVASGGCCDGIQPCNRAIGSWNDPSENTHNASREFRRATISFIAARCGLGRFFRFSIRPCPKRTQLPPQHSQRESGVKCDLASLSFCAKFICRRTG
jgi:hypothetical protein